MATVPRAVKRDVIAELYRRFDAMRWEQMSTTEKSDAYERFLADPAIGGVLEPFQDEGRTRVWIKDGPAKEYRRALEGVGSYAEFTWRALDGPDVIVHSALGEGWQLEAGTINHKPMQCRATGPNGRSKFVVWGPADSLRDLFWTVSQHKASHPDSSPVLVLTRPTTAPLARETSALAERLCELIGVEYHSVLQSLTRKAGARD